MLTHEEEKLLKALSAPPKCMHNSEKVIEHNDHWECGICGLLAKKIVKDFILEMKDDRL